MNYLSNFQTFLLSQINITRIKSKKKTNTIQRVFRIAQKSPEFIDDYDYFKIIT